MKIATSTYTSALILTLNCVFPSFCCYNMFSPLEGSESGIITIEGVQNIAELRQYADQQRVKSIIVALATDEGQKAFKDKLFKNKTLSELTQTDIEHIASHVSALQNDTVQVGVTPNDHSLAQTMHTLASQQYGLSLLMLKKQSKDLNLFVQYNEEWVNNQEKQNALLAAISIPQECTPILTDLVNKMTPEQAAKNEILGKQKVKDLQNSPAHPIATTFLYALQKRNGTLHPFIRFYNYVSELFTSDETSSDIADLP